MVGLGWGWEFVKHGIDRTEPFERGYGIESSPSNRLRHLAIFGSSFNIPLREYIDYLSPLPPQNDGGDASQTALFYLFCLSHFLASTTSRRARERERTFLSAHSTALERLTTTSPRKHTHTHHTKTHTHSRPTREIFPTWMNFQISLALSGSAGNLSAQEERREKTTAAGEAGATRRSGQRRTRPAHETGVSPEQRGGEIIMDGMDARG